MIDEDKLTDIAWLAGLLEGEGYFAFISDRPRITISMTDRDVIEEAAKLMGDPKIYLTKRPDKKDIFTIRISGYRAIGIMYQVLPFMKKRRTAQIFAVLDGWKSKRRKRHGKEGPQNTCGHPERQHRGRGMCVACYYRWRRQTKFMDAGIDINDGADLDLELGL
jgi:hypothetical protein